MRNRSPALHAVLAASLISAAAPAAEVRSAFAYRLADSTGSLPLSWAALTWDSTASELYVVDLSNGAIDIFNANGMSVYSFGNDSEVGTVLAIAPLPSGDMLALATKRDQWAVLRLNFRGELKSTIEVMLPKEWPDFTPVALRVAGERIYLADLNTMRVVVTGLDGLGVARYDLRTILKIPKKQWSDGLRGFNVDKDGNILGTSSGLFLAFRMTPEGKATSFGGRGSLPGKFNIVAGIAADEKGNIWLTDALRCAVMVYDAQLNFIDEFGYHDDDDEQGLIGPNDVAVAQGRVYVSQSRGGVKAFDVFLK